MFEFAIKSLTNKSSKNIFIIVSLSFLIFIISSVLFISSSIKKELMITLKSEPDIIVQRIVAGRQTLIDTKRVEEISKIFGIESVIDRVWGYYYLPTLGVNFSIVGIKSFEDNYKNEFDKIADKFVDKLMENSMVVGEGVYEALKKIAFNDYFYFKATDGKFKKVKIAGVFKGVTSLESNDVIVMDEELVRDIFKIDADKATDIVVNVINKNEILTIANKIRNLYPDVRVITKNDLKISYLNVFNYKSGIFLALFITALFTFFIIVFDKVSGLSSEEKREIGILKAIGWRIDDIIKVKMYEALIISTLSFLIGISLAIFYVFILKAPILKNIFTGFSVLKPPFNLPFYIDINAIILTFFVTVVVYIAVNIIPSWRVATKDADEIIR